MNSDFSFRFSNSGVKPLTKFALLLVLSVTLIFADGRFTIINRLRSAISTVLYPLQTAASYPVEKYRNGKEFFVDQSKLQEENHKLKLENARLYAQIYNQKAVARSLAELQSLENIRRPNVSVVTAAEIVIANPDPFSNKLRLNKGSNSGVEPGQAVVDANGLIGQISSTSPFISEVTLIINNKQITPVMIERTHDRALLYGDGDGVELRYLSTNVDLKADDILVTSGLDGVYAAGIPVAKIIKAEKTVASPFYRTKIVAFAGLHQSRYMFILGKESLPEHISRAIAEGENASEPSSSTSGEQP